MLVLKSKRVEGFVCSDHAKRGSHMKIEAPSGKPIADGPLWPWVIVGSIFHLIRNQADESTNAVCVAQVMRDGEWVCSEWKLPEVMR